MTNPYQKILEKKKAKWVLDEKGWDKWDNERRIEILKLEELIFKNQMAQTTGIDESLKTNEWKLWYDLEEKICALKNRIKEIKIRLDDELLFAMMITDLSLRKS